MQKATQFFFAFISFFVFTQGAMAHETLPSPAVLNFNEAGLQIRVHFISAPNVDGQTVLVLEAVNGKTLQPTAVGQNIALDLWMPSMGHGSSPTEVVPEVDSEGHPRLGVYRVNGVYFIMPGEWEVRVSLRNAKGQIETKGFFVDVDSEGGGHHGPDSLLL